MGSAGINTIMLDVLIFNRGVIDMRLEADRLDGFE